MKKLFKKGFTLVELLVVIAIIAILGTVSVVGYIGFTEDAKVSNDFTELTEYKTVAEAKLFDGSEVVVDTSKGTDDDSLDVGDKRYDFTYSVDTSSKAISELTYTYTKAEASADAVSYATYTEYNSDKATSLTSEEFSALSADEKIKTPAKAEVKKETGDLDADVDGYFWNLDAVSADTLRDGLVCLLSKSTGDEVTASYFFVNNSSNSIVSVGYRHSASKVTGEDSGINSYKVVWDIATSTVEKK